MIRRLFFILLAATQIAALPVSTDPTTAEIGLPLTLSISLPDETTRLVGLPDLGAFALLKQARQNGKILILKLLPLRPGNQTIPSFPFQTGQRLEPTTVIRLTVEAPAIPEAPHPLRPFPEDMEQEDSSLAMITMITLVAGFTVLVLMLIAVIRTRRSKKIKQTDDAADPFSLLVVAVQQTRVQNDPDWDRFCQQLDRIRFAPLPYSDEELKRLKIEFARLKGETV